MKMHLAHVRQFVTVAEGLHFGRAAEKLGITQPQLTRAVQSLEHALSVKLFSRSTRHIALTPAGATFLVEGRKLLAQAELATRLAQEAEAGIDKVVRIAFVAPALDFLPQALRAFRRAWPNTRISLERQSSDDQLAAIRSGRVDLGLISATGRDHEGLVREVVARSPFVMLTAADSELAGRASVRLADLADQPLLLPPASADPAVHEAILLACRRAGFEPNIVPGPAQAYALEALVAAGEGVTLQPEIWRAIRLQGVTHVPVVDLPDYLDWELSAVWAARVFPAPMLRSLISILRTAAGDRA